MIYLNFNSQSSTLQVTLNDKNLRISFICFQIEWKGKWKSASLIPNFCLMGYHLVYIDCLKLNNENLANPFHKGPSSA